MAVFWLAAAGCAGLPHAVPSAEELRRASGAEVRVKLRTDAVAFQRSRQDLGDRDDAGSPWSGVRLGPEEQLAVAEAVVDGGSPGSRLPLTVPGEPPTAPDQALIAVDVLSVTLSAGAGTDPPAVLWLEYRTRLALPGRNEREWRDPVESRAAYPVVQSLSAWTANGGARIRLAIAEVTREHAAHLTADLRGDLPEPPAAAPAEERRAAAEATASDAPDVDEPPAEPARPKAAAPAGGPRVHAELLPAGAGPGWEVAGALAGGVVGVFAGGPQVLGARAVVAVPVGELAGTVQGITAGITLFDRGGREDESERRRLRRDRASTGERSAHPAIDEALARASLELARTSGAERPEVIGAMRVRLREGTGAVPNAALEVEVGLKAAGAEGAAVVERTLCLRGPNAVPTELWLRDDGRLLRSAIEAQLERAVDRGLARRGGRADEGPCGEDGGG
jgi:hypothetical protein